MNLALLRNIGIIAHIDAGKTTFSERILFYSDVIHRMGEVHEGAATMDFMPEEQERGITIASACITCLWQGHVINLVDTPGHVDFTVEVERCLRVLDAAVGIFCAVGGVEPQSETVWRQADSYGIPRLAVVNKMDRVGASFSSVVTAIRERLGARAVPVTIPLGEGEEFRGVLDLVREERLVFDSDSKGKAFTRTPFTLEEAVLAAPWRESLLDALTEEDDALLELCLSGEHPAPKMLDAVLRKAVLARRLVPVFAASALRNIGVQPVLDAICRYLPSPLDIPPAAAHMGAPAGSTAGQGKDGKSGRISGHKAGAERYAASVRAKAATAGGHTDAPPETVAVPTDPKAPLCALVFKVVMAQGRRVAFIRLYAGTLREGDVLTNTSRGGSERVMRLYRLHAEQREQLEVAEAGDIVAVQGLKQACTGDTLISGGPPLLLEPIRSWRPVISLAFEPKNAEEGERLDESLALMAAEDPTLVVEMNEATGQRIVSGMGELHLEVMADRMRREYGVSPRLGNPQVVCRETVSGEGEATGEFDRELGGQAHYGKVRLRVSAKERESGTDIAFDCDAADWSAALLEAVEQGISDACYSGPGGYPVDDIRVAVLSLERKGALATPAGMHMAAQNAVRHALEKAKPLVLEPIMQVDITVPESFLGPVISLLGARGARVENLTDKAGQKEVQALAPMRGLFGFSTALRSATQGRAGVVMQFSRFDSV